MRHAALDRACEIAVVSGAVRLAPSHEREYMERLRHVREYHDNEAGRAEEQKSRCCRTSAHTLAKHRSTQTINPLSR